MRAGAGSVGAVDRFRALARNPYVSVVWASVLLAVVAGVVWGLIAPGLRFQAVDDSSAQLVTGDEFRAFGTTMRYVFVTAVLGLVIGVAAWWRLGAAVRGPALVLATLIGTALAAPVTATIGDEVIRLRHRGDQPSQAGDIFTVATGLGTWTAFIVAPAVALLVLVFGALVNSHDDLRVG